jgi:hypothetical protein
MKSGGGKNMTSPGSGCGWLANISEVGPCIHALQPKRGSFSVPYQDALFRFALSELAVILVWSLVHTGGGYDDARLQTSNVCPNRFHAHL